MTKDTGGPAFPIAEVRGPNNCRIMEGWGGMTLRDWFAGQALIAFIQADGAQFFNATKEHAVGAYQQADAMLAEKHNRE